MFESTDRIVHSANLLVCIGGLATATGVITGGGAVIGGYLSWRQVMKRLPAGAAPLAKTIEDRLRTKIAAEAAAMNGDTALLIPQMIEAARPDPKLVVEAGLQADALLDLMVDTLTFHEHRLPDHVGVFRRILKPILTDLLKDPGFTQQLAPEFHRAVLAFLSEMSESLAHLSERYGSLSKSLDDLRNLRLRDLQFLALKFGLETGDGATAEALVGELQKKAEDVRAYQAEINAIDERTKGLGNLKGAAKDAAGRLDFDEVETLLARVQEVELEIAAETAELRARNALMRGRVDQAYTLLNAAADSFAGVDPLEPARRKILTYSENFKEHGENYGLEAYRLGQKIVEAAVDEHLRTKDIRLWAAGHAYLGIFKSNIGRQIGGLDGIKMEQEAISNYETALTVCTPKHAPFEWALYKQNLAITFFDLAENLGNSDGKELFQYGIQHIRDSLSIQLPIANFQDWAMKQNTLGNALANLGEITPGKPGLEHLNQAVSSFDMALSVYTKENFPTDHIKTKINRAITTLRIGERLGGESGIKIIKNSISDLKIEILRLDPVSAPQTFAMAQLNLGRALEGLAQHLNLPYGKPYFLDAVDTYRKAQTSYKNLGNKIQWANAGNNLANVLTVLGTYSLPAERDAYLCEAQDRLLEVLSVWEQSEHPVRWAVAKFNLALVYLALGKRTNGPEGVILLESALDFHSEALEVRTKEFRPNEWAMSQIRIALTRQAIALHENCADSTPHLKAALSHVEAALEVYNPDHMPYNHGTATALRNDIREALDRLGGAD